MARAAEEEREVEEDEAEVDLDIFDFRVVNFFG